MRRSSLLHEERIGVLFFCGRWRRGAAALLSSMGYNEEERIQVKLEFLRMMLRLRLDPARAELLTVFFETYLPLNQEEEEQLMREIEEQGLQERLKSLNWMTSYERRGYEKGKEEGQELGKEELLISLLRSGMSVAAISEATRVPQADLEKLRQKL